MLAVTTACARSGTIGCAEPAKVPQLDRLVFAVGDDVASVAPGVDVGDAVDVSGQDADWAGPRLSEGPSVPDFAHPVVTAGR